MPQVLVVLTTMMAAASAGVSRPAPFACWVRGSTAQRPSPRQPRPRVASRARRSCLDPFTDRRQSYMDRPAPGAALAPYGSHASACVKLSCTCPTSFSPNRAMARCSSVLTSTP